MLDQPSWCAELRLHHGEGALSTSKYSNSHYDHWRASVARITRADLISFTSCKPRFLTNSKPLAVHSSRELGESSMRVNIYAEELRPITDKYGDRVTRIEKQVVADLPKPHQAIQILLGDRVMHTENSSGKDDDTPGVKFWYYSEYERELLVGIFDKALAELRKPAAKGE